VRNYQLCKAVYSLACSCLLLQYANAFCRPQQFEAEGIDGISNGQTVDLRTVPRVEPPSQQEKPVVQKSAVLNRTFYDSEEDEEDEEHELGCACCPGGRNVVFRVY
jgi:hypothetical protein